MTRGQWIAIIAVVVVIVLAIIIGFMIWRNMRTTMVPVSNINNAAPIPNQGANDSSILNNANNEAVIQPQVGMTKRTVTVGGKKAPGAVPPSYRQILGEEK